MPILATRHLGHKTVESLSSVRPNMRPETWAEAITAFEVFRSMFTPETFSALIGVADKQGDPPPTAKSGTEQGVDADGFLTELVGDIPEAECVRRERVQEKLDSVRLGEVSIYPREVYKPPRRATPAVRRVAAAPVHQVSASELLIPSPCGYSRLLPVGPIGVILMQAAALRYAPFNRGLLDAVGSIVLGVLRGPADRLAMLASTLRQPPPGTDWRPCPWVSSQTYPRLRTLSGERDPVRLVGEAGRRLAEGGVVVDHVATHLLALLAEEITAEDERAMRTASCWRSPPEGAGWVVWPYLVPRLVARAGMTGGAPRNAQVAGWAAWRLARQHRVVVASSAIRGSAHGRIRFARLAEASCR